jgi:homoserine O-acetyltransferase
MGACQSYAWAALHPEMVDAIAPISGSARTANFNKVFLAGNIRAITGDANWRGGFYSADAPPVNGVRAMAALYAGWGFSEAFYRQELFRAFGAADVDQFIELFWDQFFQKCDANDLLAQMWTWKHNDLGDHPNFAGDFEAALRSIQARTIVIQAETDSYFPPVDSEYEVQTIPGAELRVIPTIWGHIAPFNPEDQAVIDSAIDDLL